MFMHSDHIIPPPPPTKLFTPPTLVIRIFLSFVVCRYMFRAVLQNNTLNKTKTCIHCKANECHMPYKQIGLYHKVGYN